MDISAKWMYHFGCLWGCWFWRIVWQYVHFGGSQTFKPFTILWPWQRLRTQRQRCWKATISTSDPCVLCAIVFVVEQDCYAKKLSYLLFYSCVTFASLCCLLLAVKIYERPPKPPTFWNSYTRTLILDTIMKLSGTIGVTQKTMTFDTHVWLIFFTNVKSLGTMRDTRKTMTISATSFRGCNRFSPLLIWNSLCWCNLEPFAGVPGTVKGVGGVIEAMQKKCGKDGVIDTYKFWVSWWVQQRTLFPLCVASKRIWQQGHLLICTLVEVLLCIPRYAMIKGERLRVAWMHISNSE